MFCQIAGQDAVRIRAECPPARAPGLRALTHGLNGRAELCVTLEISSDCQEVSLLVASRRGATLCHRGHQQEEGHVQGAGGQEGHVHGATHVRTPPASIRKRPTSCPQVRLQRTGFIMALSIPGP